jgi:hypothetical protein
MPAIPSEFLAIDRKARAKIPTQDIATRPVSERVCDFNDVIIPMSAEQACSRLPWYAQTRLRYSRPITIFLRRCG